MAAQEKCILIIYLFVHSFMDSFMDSFIHSVMYLFICLLILFTYVLIGQTDSQPDRQPDKQTARQTDSQTDRQPVDTLKQKTIENIPAVSRINISAYHASTELLYHWITLCSFLTEIFPKTARARVCVYLTKRMDCEMFPLMCEHE